MIIWFFINDLDDDLSSEFDIGDTYQYKARGQIKKETDKTDQQNIE